MLDTNLPALLSYLLEITSLLATLLLGWAVKRFRDWTGIQIEARHREALHSALMTGVRYALDRHLPPAQAIETAVDYAKAIGAPDAIAALDASQEALGAIAEAKMQEAGRTQESIRPVAARFQAFSACQFQGMSSSMRLIL